MSDRSEQRYDAVIGPSVTLNPLTWFRWERLFARLRRQPTRATEEQPYETLVTPPLPITAPEPTPAPVTVPASAYSVLAEAVEVVAHCWPDSPAADTEGLCVMGLPLMGNPFGAWRDGNWHADAIASILDGYARASKEMRRTVWELQQHPERLHLMITVLAPLTPTWEQCANQLFVPPFVPVITGALGITIGECDVHVVTSSDHRNGGEWEFVLWADDDRYDEEMSA